MQGLICIIEDEWKAKEEAKKKETGGVVDMGQRNQRRSFGASKEIRKSSCVGSTADSLSNADKV